MIQADIDKLSEDLLIDGDVETREVHINGKLLRPDRSQKIHNHSPDGFNWGYSGSGPAQLALAILLDQLNDETAAQKYYQQFKFRIVSSWPMDQDFEVRLNLKQIMIDIIAS